MSPFDAVTLRRSGPTTRLLPLISSRRRERRAAQNTAPNNFLWTIKDAGHTAFASNYHRFGERTGWITHKLPALSAVQYICH
jgi:hypothetical protein